MPARATGRSCSADISRHLRTERRDHRPTGQLTDDEAPPRNSDLVIGDIDCRDWHSIAQDADHRSIRNMPKDVVLTPEGFAAVPVIRIPDTKHKNRPHDAG
jgi:hypothetical protein